jgi:hypothetical protein
VEYHFSSDMQMLTIFCSPEPASVTLAVSPFENVTGFKLPVDQEVECEEFEALPIDDSIINDNQSGLGVAPMQDTMSCADNEPLELSTTVPPPKTMTKTLQQLNNSSSLKKRPKTKNNSKAFTVAGVDATAGTENVSRTIPRLPAALTAHAGWKIIGTASLEESIFTSKSALLDNFLTTRINDYIIDIREQLRSKLENVSFEVNDLNLFTFLLSSGLEYIIEYLNESLTRMGLNKTSMHEFRRFIGTLLLLGSFNLSTEQSWDLMEKITNNKVMSNERFNEIMKNLRGFEVSMRHGGGRSSTLCDQKDKFQFFHFLEDHIFERSRGIFFPRDRGGCYVLDDELISLKAVDIEVKTLSSRKSGKEGSTVDVLCDSFFQLIVGMRLQTSSETQEENVKQLLSTLPRTNNSYDSPHGPILACDRGYGKLSLIKFFMEQNFKVITVCAAVGSGHPIVTESEVNKVMECRQNQGKCDSNNNISQQLVNWLIKDDESILRGPEIKIASCNTVGEKTLHAIAYRDIFDKKKGQKILRFFAAGFAGMEDALCHWAAVAKCTANPIFGQLFGSCNSKDEKLLEMQQMTRDAISHVNVLTENQRTVEWFTLCAFHLSATMAGCH